jgi:hypothetical protein
VVLLLGMSRRIITHAIWSSSGTMSLISDGNTRKVDLDQLGSLDMYSHIVLCLPYADCNVVCYGYIRLDERASAYEGPMSPSPPPHRYDAAGIARSSQIYSIGKWWGSRQMVASGEICHRAGTASLSAI